MQVDDVATFPDVSRIVSVSDVHGHRERFESALLTLADHPGLDAVVDRTGGNLHWVAGTDAVLVVNGDVVNKGPDSEGCLALIERLRADAPDGHVRFLLGNSELGLVYPTPPDIDVVYAHTVDDDQRRRILEWARDGRVSLAFQGYEYTYVHAGSADCVDVRALNDALQAVATTHLDRVGQADEREAFEALLDDACPELVPPDIDPEAGEDLSDAPDAGVVFLHFSHLPADAPPQIVGHTPRASIACDGAVVCQDVITENADSPGGEAVLVETKETLRSVVRTPDGGVRVEQV